MACSIAGVVLVADVAVQDRDVIFDHDVHVRDVEALLERTDAGADPVGEDVVAHVRIGLPTREPVQDPGGAPGRVAHVSCKATCELPGCPTDGCPVRGRRDGREDSGGQARGLQQAFRCRHGGSGLSLAPTGACPVGCDRSKSARTVDGVVGPNVPSGARLGYDGSGISCDHSVAAAASATATGQPASGKLESFNRCANGCTATLATITAT